MDGGGPLELDDCGPGACIEGDCMDGGGPLGPVTCTNSGGLLPLERPVLLHEVLDGCCTCGTANTTNSWLIPYFTHTRLSP